MPVHAAAPWCSWASPPSRSRRLNSLRLRLFRPLGPRGLKPRSPLRLVGGDDDAVCARLGAEEPQSCSCVRAEELVAVADEQRVDPEAQLVEQAVVEQRLAERAMAVHDEIAVALLLELADRGGDVAADDGRLHPGRLD